MMIPMVDLRNQYLKIKEEIDDAIHQVIDRGDFIRGEAVSRFQESLQNYLSVSHVVTCGNGTDALQIALMALDLKRGDEVLTPSFTFIATAEVIALLGLRPVFVDVDPDTFLMDIGDLRSKITSRSKAIVPVHLFGQCADMESIMEIAKKHSLYVVEDACQSIGATSTLNGVKVMSGTIGDIGCVSFFPSKNLGCYGDGGAIFTQNENLSEKCKSIANHGMLKRYYHDHVGVNSRLDTIQAAVLEVKLKYLNEYTASRQKVAHIYDEAFLGCDHIQTPQLAQNTTHVYHQYTLLIRREGLREKIQLELKRRDIASAIYYPVPVHLQKAYADFGYRLGDLPATELLANQVISLPIHTEMNEQMLGEIVEGVRSCL